MDGLVGEAILKEAGVSHNQHSLPHPAIEEAGCQMQNDTWKKMK